MSKPKVFISYSHVDEKRWKNRLQKHLKVLEKHGSLSFWEDRRIAAGQEWHAEIKAALDSADAAILLISPDFLGSNFILNEEVPAILRRRMSDGMRIFPLIVRSCPWQNVGWLKPLQARPTNGKPLAQFRGDDVDRILAELVSEIEALLNQPRQKPSAETEAQTDTDEAPSDECPYLGLEAFTEATQHLFFGRDDFADALFDKVKRQNFVALVGPSGSGKSSVVQAGLFPRLRRDAESWATILFPPREDPFLSLAAGFVWLWHPQANPGVNINEAKKLAAELKDAQRLIEAIQRTVAAPDGQLLLVVDQFEEMFTLCAESDRRDFLDALMAVKGAAPATVMLTLRSDFMGQAQSFSPAFSQLLDEGIISHRLLTRDDLEAVITGPARYAKLDVEPGLVNLILQEVAGQHDSLPLLEYALKEMWRQKGRSRVFDHTLYEAVGKVEGAISQHADAVLSALPEAEQALALRALTRLVRVAGEEGEADTRLRLPLGELPEAERAVLQTFVTARLLVTKREEGAGAETIEVSHEALIRWWEKLREALDSDREFLMWWRRLDSRRKAWEQKGRDDKWLLYGGERNDAQRWLNERGAELTSFEVEFITWDDRPEFQIERILFDSPSLLHSSGGEMRKSWFASLVFCRKVEKAISVAREIEFSWGRAHALRSIAEALGKAGMATEAREVAMEALATTHEIEDAGDRARALRSIAEALGKAGMATEACEVAMETLPTAREIKHAYSRGRVLSSIAEVLGKVGMATESREVLTEAGEAAMKALAAARKTKNASYRATILISIAEDLVKAEMVPEALAAAREIEKRYDRAKALYSIAKELVKAEMVPEALAAAREVEVAYDQAEGLMAVVDFWLGRRQGDEARNLLEEVQGVVSKVFDDLNRSNVMQHLAIILARLHSYRAARETAMQCFSSEHRLAAYIAILREYHIERDPGLAQLFAKEEEEEED